MTQLTTWNEKLDEPSDIEIRPMPGGRRNLRAGQRMLVPNGRAVATAFRTIPTGLALTPKELRVELARAHGADITCPVTTGICLRAVAEAAFEAISAGAPSSEITPVWRVLDARAPTLRNVSFTPAFMLDQRARESSDATS